MAEELKVFDTTWRHAGRCCSIGLAFIAKTLEFSMTPERVDGHIAALVDRVVPGGTPVHLLVEAERFARKNECFPAVAEKIRRDGGQQILGWQIWEGKLIVEAEFHAIWKSPDGLWKDITPKPLFISRILFLPDEKAVYTGAQVDNVRVNVSGNPVVDDFIHANEGKFALLNAGDRAFAQEVRLNPDEDQLLQFLNCMMALTARMGRTGRGIGDPCLCRSGQDYRNCHRAQLQSALATLR